ncbi:tyrosine-type recombinase/integrase [Natronoarchaeum sp. GCM10025703]|uniref:tyrosine-type recombinase/integrase n=1 Tax=unclassified Natronoarchaeum TaxID=2620183 RepID=UPI003617AE70
MSNPEYELYETEPETALERYISDRENEVQSATLRSHKARLKKFIEWCGIEGIENMNDLNGRNLQDFRYWRKEDGDLNNVTLHTQMTTFRVFITWCEDFQAVTPGLHEKIRVPKLDPGEDVSNDKMEPEKALKILDYLEKFQYASRDHAMFRLLFRTGVRTGGLRTLNVSDYHSEDQYIEVKHRPEKDTPLKNGSQGQRPIYLNSMTCQVLEDYIENNRIEAKDDYGQKPLLTTNHGRLSPNTIRQRLYKLSHPCFYTGKCPHDENPKTCDFKNNVDYASQCPSSKSPHSVRKASITYWRQRDTPAQQVGERANVNQDIIEKHYDKRTDKGKMDQRKDFFDRE